MPPKNKTGAASAQNKSRAPKAHKLPDPFPKGEILKDCGKKLWCLGDVIGQGGFGRIYTATLVEPGHNETYVVKIEPISNGPLFCELHVYQRLAKPEMIETWAKSKKLKYLGIPKYISSGSHTRGKETFRFMIMEQFGTDVQKIFEKAGKKFSRHTVCSLALRLVDTLEYLHNKGYAHADIKASNLLTGFSNGKEQPNQVYLVDYGLAYKFYCDGSHKEYKEDPKRCHDGTIEFTSTDAHKGVAPSRRGDLEILGYCLLQWSCSRLPWETNLENKDTVRDSKIRYMKDIPGLMKACFQGGSYPDEISKFLTYVSKLKYDEVPDYNKVKSLFEAGISGKDEWKIDLPLSIASSTSKAARKRKSVESETPAEKKLKSSAKQTPKAKAVRRTKTLKSPVNTPKTAHKQMTSPVNDVKKMTPQTKSRAPTPQSSAGKRSRSRTPVRPVEQKGSEKKTTRRKVKRKKAVQTSDASIQTSPGFSSG